MLIRGELCTSLCGLHGKRRGGDGGRVCYIEKEVGERGRDRHCKKVKHTGSESPSLCLLLETIARITSETHGLLWNYLFLSFLGIIYWLFSAEWCFWWLWNSFCSPRSQKHTDNSSPEQDLDLWSIFDQTKHDHDCVMHLFSCSLMSAQV